MKKKFMVNLITMDYKVTSEIYEEYDYASSTKPKINDANVVSKFYFKCKPEKPKIDEDGDFVVTRKLEDSVRIIEIEHSKRTSLDLVGMQMWRGSLLLADWLIHNAEFFGEDSIILELGGGVGFTSIVASMYCSVICTDVDRGDLFQIMESNIKRNEGLAKFPVTILDFDFYMQTIPIFIEQHIEKISMIIAAEVIYHDQLTDAFVKTVEHLLSVSQKGKSVVLATEKRYVFTIADCDSVAPCYEYFLRRVSSSKLSYEEIPLEFTQYFKYDRVKELVLCRLKLKN